MSDKKKLDRRIIMTVEMSVSNEEFKELEENALNCNPEDVNDENMILHSAKCIDAGSEVVLFAKEYN